MSNAEDIKKWLKTIGKNRQWLAEQTLSSKGTVNNWLSSGKPIPSAKLALIERLMNGEDEIQFELPEDFEAIIREKAKAAKKSIDDLVIEILEMTVQKLKKSNRQTVRLKRQLKSHTQPWITTMTNRKKSTTSFFALSSCRKSWLLETSLQGKSRGANLTSHTQYLTRVLRPYV